MATQSDVPKNSEEWRAFLQERVKGFGITLARFILGFYVLSNSVAMAHPKAVLGDWVSPLNLLVLTAGLICTGVWLSCRSAQRTSRGLESIDGLATVAVGTCIGLTLIFAPPVQRPELSAIMGV